MNIKLFKIATLSVILLSRVHGMENDSENKSPFENLSFDKKVEIGELLNREDLRSYGIVNHEFDDARSQVLKSNRERFIQWVDASELTADRVSLLRRFKALEIRVVEADDAAIKRIIQLDNIRVLWVYLKPSTSFESLKEFSKLPKLEKLTILGTKEHVKYMDKENLYEEMGYNFHGGYEYNYKK